MRVPVTFLLLLLGVAAMLVTPTAHTAGQEAPPAPTPTRASWLILPPFPADATQADIGAEVYRLVCEACHGDRGQGLTDAWIASWPAERQNCWTSKCHAANHPPDGFALPRAVPALIGPAGLRRFATALDLYRYVRARMPWHNPGSLADDEYWQLTAFLIREQGIDPMLLPLDGERAATLYLYPERASAQAAPGVPAPVRPAGITPAGAAFWWLLLGVPLMMVALLFLYRGRRAALRR